MVIFKYKYILFYECILSYQFLNNSLIKKLIICILYYYTLLLIRKVLEPNRIPDFAIEKNLVFSRLFLVFLSFEHKLFSKLLFSPQKNVLSYLLAVEYLIPKNRYACKNWSSFSIRKNVYKNFFFLINIILKLVHSSLCT